MLHQDCELHHIAFLNTYTSLIPSFINARFIPSSISEEASTHDIASSLVPFIKDDLRPLRVVTRLMHPATCHSYAECYPVAVLPTKKRLPHIEGAFTFIKI